MKQKKKMPHILLPGLIFNNLSHPSTHKKSFTDADFSDILIKNGFLF